MPYIKNLFLNIGKNAILFGFSLPSFYLNPPENFGVGVISLDVWIDVLASGTSS